MWNAGLDEAQARIKIARRNINNLRYADDTTLTQMLPKKENRKEHFLTHSIKPSFPNQNETNIKTLQTNIP